MDQQGLARLQFCLSDDCIMRSNEYLRNCTCFHPIEILRYSCKMILGNNNEFSLRASGSNTEDSMTNFPQAHFGPDCLHLTGKLEPGHIQWITWWSRIPASKLQHVSSI